MFFKRLTPEAKIAQIKQYEQDMYRVAMGILGNEEDCKDALQEAIFRAYNNLAQLKEKQYMKTWLIRIVINECNRVYEKRKKACSITLFEVESLGGGQKEELLDLHEGVNQLPEQYKVPIVLHYFSGCNYEEIAKVMEIPIGTVKSRMSKARGLLKEYLGGDWNE